MCNLWKLFKFEARLGAEGVNVPRVETRTRAADKPPNITPRAQPPRAQPPRVCRHSVHPSARSQSLAGRRFLRDMRRPPASVWEPESRLQLLHKRPEKVAESGWWEMNVPGKQQPERNQRTAGLLLPTSVSRTACLSPSWASFICTFATFLNVGLTLVSVVQRVWIIFKSPSKNEQ